MLKKEKAYKLTNNSEDNYQNEDNLEEQAMNHIKRESQIPFIKNCTCHILESFTSPNFNLNNKSNVNAPKRPIKPGPFIRRSPNHYNIQQNLIKNNQVFQENIKLIDKEILIDNPLFNKTSYREFVNLINEKVKLGNQILIKHKINKLEKLDAKNIPEEEQDKGNFNLNIVSFSETNNKDNYFSSANKKVEEFVSDSKICIEKKVSIKKFSKSKGKQKVNKLDEKDMVSIRRPITLNETKIEILIPNKKKMNDKGISSSIDLMCNTKVSDQNGNRERVKENDKLSKNSDKVKGDFMQQKFQIYEKEAKTLLTEDIIKNQDPVKMQYMKKILNQTASQYYHNNLASNYTYPYPLFQYFPMPSSFIPMYFPSINSPVSLEYKKNVIKNSSQQTSKRKLKIESSINNSVSINPINENLDLNFNSLALNPLKSDTLSQTIEKSLFKSLGRESIGKLIDSSKLLEETFQPEYITKNDLKMQQSSSNFNKKSSLIVIENEQKCKTKRHSRILEMQKNNLTSEKFEIKSNKQLLKNELKVENKILNSLDHANLMNLGQKVVESSQILPIQAYPEKEEQLSFEETNPLSINEKKAPNYILKIKKGIIKKRSVNDTEKKDLIADRMKELNSKKISPEKIKEIDDKLSMIANLNTHSKVKFIRVNSLIAISGKNVKP